MASPTAVSPSAPPRARATRVLPLRPMPAMYSTFAGRFGSAPEDLRGRHWEACFPPREVDRLRADALTAVREGWQWDGGCEGLRADGATVPVRVRLVGLDDGSLVFRVAPPET